MYTSRFPLWSLLAVTLGAVVLAATASGSHGVRGPVVIKCSGVQPPRGPERLPRGSCSVTGAITDQGKFVDDARLTVHPHVRWFYSDKGMMKISVFRERGHWKIVEGTGAYEGLRGRGWHSPSRPCPTAGVSCAISFTMTGRVWH